MSRSHGPGKMSSQQNTTQDMDEIVSRLRLHMSNSILNITGDFQRAIDEYVASNTQSVSSMTDSHECSAGMSSQQDITQDTDGMVSRLRLHMSNSIVNITGDFQRAIDEYVMENVIGAGSSNVKNGCD